MDDGKDNQQQQEEDSWTQWTCDELTPALCELRCQEGLVWVDGFPIHYWQYTADYNILESTSEEHHTNNDEVAVTKSPIIVIHGGPGFPHNYLLPLRQQACRGRPIIFYDQAGCGKSIVPSTTPTTTISTTFSGKTSAADNNKEAKYNPASNINTHDFPWLLDPHYYATKELPTLIQHLGLQQYHLVGHSWGTIIAQLYALEEYPGIQSLTLLGPISDTRLMEQAMWDTTTGNLGTLPPFVQRQIQYLQANSLFNSKEYLAIDQVLRERFICRTVPWPDCFTEAQDTQNLAIQHAMRGPSMFANGGLLSHFNITSQLIGSPLATLPIKLMAGQYDIIQPVVLHALHRNLPLSEITILTESGHAMMIDEPAATNSQLDDFLTRVEKGNFIPHKPSSSDTIHWTWVAERWWPLAVTFLLSLVLGFVLAQTLLKQRQRTTTSTTMRRKGYQPVP
jgi:proline-specific peptidase